MLFQNLHILADGGFVHGVSQIGVLHVCIDGIDLDGLTVQVEYLMTDLGFLESHLTADLLHDLSGFAEQFQLQLVEHRRLARPLVGIGDERRQLHGLLPLPFHREGIGGELLHLITFRIGKRGTHGVGATSVLIFLHIDSHLERGILVLVVKIGGYIPVEQARLGRGIERHIIEDTRQAPVVLSFQIVAVAIFKYTYRQKVLTRLYIRSYVVFGRLLTAFVITYLMTVYPYERSALCLFQTKEYLLSLP